MPLPKVIPLSASNGAASRGGATSASGPAASGLVAPPPLSLYIHVPWCVRKCPYCDFNSHEPRGGIGAIPEDAYVDALIADLEAALPLVWGRPVGTIFIGGGTPSLLSGAALERLLGAVRARLPLTPGAEITLEANPGTAEAGKFAAFAAAGVTRLSLGIQSFNPRHLKALGRIHDDNEARAAIELAARHFERFNLDLMYGLPGQSLDEAQADLETALSFAPPHLSAYHLTLEPNTAFGHTPPPDLPDDEVAADMQEAVEARLAAAGFEHYETSAFAKPGYRCQHNLNYWTFGDYLGIGAGAHGKLSSHEGIRRQMRWKSPRDYLAKAPLGEAVQSDDWVAAEELPFEFLMNALRLNDGFDARLFQERTGLPLLTIARQLEAAQADGLLVRDFRPAGEGQVEWIAPTPRGRRFLNTLLQRFLP